jgi:hypothetical protein
VEQQALKLNFKLSFFVPRGTIVKTDLNLFHVEQIIFLYLKNVSRGTNNFSLFKKCFTWNMIINLR